MDDVSGFLRVITEVDWMSETRLVLILVTIYTICIVASAFTWKHVNLQAVYFVILCIAIYWAESLNRLCAMNWKLIAKQQYFDSNGMFISVVYSTPLLLNLLAILVHWMRSAAGDLIIVKRKELAERNKKADKKNE